MAEKDGAKTAGPPSPPQSQPPPGKQPQTPPPPITHTPPTPIPAPNGTPPLFTNGGRIQLDQPPSPRIKGQPLQVPQSSQSPAPQHWRRQRRASDVIDSGGIRLSPGGTTPPLASSLPRELLLGGGPPPRSPTSPASDRGYGGSTLTSPASPVRSRDQVDARVTAAPVVAAPEDSGFSAGTEAPMFVEKDAEEYYMKHPRRGQAIIFNNDQFQMPGMADRQGSDVDVESLKNSFRTLLFDVTVYDNLSYGQINTVLQELAAADHSDADCLSITVLTHGVASGYLLAHDVPYTVQSLWQHFTADKCPTLAGKPKLFFIQACRGDQLDAGVTLRRRSRTETDSAATNYKIPTHGDFLLAFSAAEGFYSWRNTDNGTWFVQCLSQELAANGHKMDILRILTRVSRRVALDHESFNDLIPWQHQCKQVPCFNSMLIRDLIFHPKE